MVSLASTDKNKLLKIIIGVTVAAVILFIVIVSLVLSLVINLEFYDNRLGLNWWTFFTMNNAAILWCPLITILILVAVVTCLNPMTSSTLTFVYGGLKRHVRPSRIKCLIWNYALVAGIGGLAMGWVVGFVANAGFGIFVADQINLSYSFFPTLFTALSYPLNPGTMDPNTLFAFTFILRPFIILVVGAIMGKLGLDLANSIAFRERRGTNPIKAAGTIALLISLGFFIWWLFLPSGSYDVIESAVVFPIVIIFFAGLGIGIAFYIIGVVNPQRYRREQFYKSIIALAMIILFVVPIAFFISAGVKSLQYEARWNEWTWDTKLTAEISETRTAAGIFNYSEYTTQQLFNNQSVTDEEILPHIRMFDYEASRVSMENEIGSLWETLADSDIVFVNETEYWIAPRAIRSTDQFARSWVQDHIIYTHSRGFVALNPVTGNTVLEESYESIFGIPDNSSIYFGEQPDNGYTLLNVTQYEEIENITYSGPVDITLTGFLNWWYIEDWGFKTTQETNYLIKRNIFDRIEGIFLPYMITGDDPYLVFDSANSKMYYCVDIILDFPAFSGYMQSDIVRWLGVVLVDTKTGSMIFYQYNDTIDNLPYEFLQIYVDMYDWQPMPSWLMEQLKYPEILIEYQLSIDYTYHVTDASTWKNEDDFFELPENTDLYYIMYDLGYDLTYVGASMVQFKDAEVPNLVGFYIVENHPQFLGRTTFYRNGTAGLTDMLGLYPAVSAYQQEDAAFLQLLLNYRFGNYLIYPLAGSLYYVIPVYEISGDDIQTLMRVALVNAFDVRHIGIGDNITAAYNALNITTVIPQGVLSLNVVSAPAILEEGSYGDLELLINNDYPDQSFDVTLNITTEYDLFNVSLAGSEITRDLIGGNYTYFIANFSLLPTQYIGIIPKISGQLPGGAESITIKYQVNLYYDNGTLIQAIERSLYIYK